VPNDEHPVPLTELDEGIPRTEIVDARSRVDTLGLEHVLVRDGVELCNDDALRRRVGTGDDRFVDGASEPEGVAIGVPERQRLSCGRDVCTPVEEETTGQ